MFDWDRAFKNINVNEKVFILSKTILNVLSYFIPHQTLTVDDNHPPPPLGLQLKISSKRKIMFIRAIEIVKKYHLRRLKVLQEDLYKAIEVSN